MLLNESISADQFLDLHFDEMNMSVSQAFSKHESDLSRFFALHMNQTIQIIFFFESDGSIFHSNCILHACLEHALKILINCFLHMRHFLVNEYILHQNIEYLLTFHLIRTNKQQFQFQTTPKRRSISLNHHGNSLFGITCNVPS